MQINHGAISSQGQQNQIQSGSSQQGQIQQSGMRPEANVDLRGLQAGKTFKGEIVDIRNSQIFIDVGNNQIVSARLAEPMNLYIGQTLSFQVKSNNGKQISIRPMFETLSQNPTVLKALEAAGIPLTDKTAMLIQTLLQEQMPIDKNTIQQLLKQMAAFQNADISTIVQMNKLKIPVTEENIQQFENYKNYEHRVVKEIDQAASNIPKLLADISVNQGIKEALNLHEGFVRIFLENEYLQEDSMLLKDGGVVVKGENLSEAIISKENMEMTEREMQILQEAPPKGGQTEFVKDIFGYIQADSTDSMDLNLSPEMKVLAAEGNVQISATASQTELIQLLSPEEREHFIEQLKQFNLSEEEVQMLREGKIEAKEVVKLVHKLFQGKGLWNESSIKDFFSGKEYQTILKAAISEQWLLKPADLAKEGTVGDLYKRLSQQTEKISQLLTETGRDNSALMKDVAGIRQNIDFMQQLNQLMSYVQLPLKLKHQNAHSELYVYTNKKNFGSLEDGVSALLHLDMDLLGTMDIYIAMKKVNVNAKFYMEKGDIIPFIEENTEILKKRLIKKGYFLETEVMIRKKEENAMEAFLEQERTGSGSMHRFSFDVRA